MKKIVFTITCVIFLIAGVSVGGNSINHNEIQEEQYVDSGLVELVFQSSFQDADCGLVGDLPGCKDYPTSCNTGGHGAGNCKIFCDSGHSFKCEEQDDDPVVDFALASLYPEPCGN